MSDPGKHPRPKLTLIQGGLSTEGGAPPPPVADPNELAAYLDFAESQEHSLQSRHSLYDPSTTSDEPLLSVSLLTALEKYQALLTSADLGAGEPEDSDEANFYIFSEGFESHSVHKDPPARKRVTHELSRTRPLTPGERKIRRKTRQSSKLENVEPGEPSALKLRELPQRKTHLRLVLDSGESSL